MKEFVCNEAAGFQVNTTKCELLYIYFSEFGQLFRNTYFKERIWTAVSTIYFFNLVALP